MTLRLVVTRLCLVISYRPSPRGGITKETYKMFLMTVGILCWRFRHAHIYVPVEHDGGGRDNLNRRRPLTLFACFLMRPSQKSPWKTLWGASVRGYAPRIKLFILGNSGTENARQRAYGSKTFHHYGRHELSLGACRVYI